MENQGYIHYRKGALVMYRLKEAVGEDAVDRGAAPPAARIRIQGRALSVLEGFREDPARGGRPKYESLITDLFEKITLYDVKADHAHAQEARGRALRPALQVDAKKVYADGTGRETAAPMKEDVFTGLFLSEPGKAGFNAAKVVYYARQPIVTGKQTLHFVVNTPPKFAGIDPYNLWIDRNSNDNLVPDSGP